MPPRGASTAMIPAPSVMHEEMFKSFQKVCCLALARADAGGTSAQGNRAKAALGKSHIYSLYQDGQIKRCQIRASNAVKRALRPIISAV